MSNFCFVSVFNFESPRHSESLMVTIRIDLFWWLLLSTKSTQIKLSHHIINSTTQLDGLFLLFNAVRQETKKNLMSLCSICRFQTARISSVFLYPPYFSSAAVSLCLTMFNVSALTCVLLLFLHCRDLFHSLQPPISAHGSARRNYLFTELVDGQEAPHTQCNT